MKRLQNRIAESRFALPVTAVYVLAAWLACGLVQQRLYAEFALFAVSAYLMVELNNRNSLIRIYSRMVSCTFLVLSTMAAAAFMTPVLASADAWLVQLCFIGAYLMLFSAYQDKRAQGKVFYAFMFIGVASVVFVQALFFVPILLILAGTNLMAFSGRNFWAALIGLTVPYWFYGGYCAMTGNTAYIMTHFAANAWVAPPAWQADISISGIATISFTLLVTLIGSAHFLRNSYKDKIRTRMIYEMLISMSAFTIVFMALQPQHAAMLTGIQIINASPLAAHFIALTNTRLTNITFGLLAIAALAITAFNILAGGAI